MASIRKIRGRDGRRREPTALFAVGAGAVAGRARTLRDEPYSSETGSGHDSSGSAWIDWKVRVCAQCVTWGSSLPDGDPKILVGRDPESRIFFWNTRFFPCCACHFRKIFLIRARLRFFCEFSKILVQGKEGGGRSTSAAAAEAGMPPHVHTNAGGWQPQRRAPRRATPAPRRPTAARPGGRVREPRGHS